MNLYDQLPEINEKVKSVIASAEVTIVEGDFYFRYDTDDSDSREQWDNYIFVSEALSSIGYELDDPYTEHDCITGVLKKK